jgi:hypothetical protein
MGPRQNSGAVIPETDVEHIQGHACGGSAAERLDEALQR